MVAEKIMEFAMEWIIGLPLTVTARSESRAVRMMGLLWFAAWIPISMAGILLSLPLILVVIVEETWHGH